MKLFIAPRIRSALNRFIPECRNGRRIAPIRPIMVTRKAGWTILGVLILAAMTPAAKADNISLDWGATTGTAPSVVGAITYDPATDSLPQFSLVFDGVTVTTTSTIYTEDALEGASFNYTCSVKLSTVTCQLVPANTSFAAITLTGTGTPKSAIDSDSGSVEFVATPEPGEVGLTLLGVGLVLIGMRKRIAQGLQLPAEALPLPTTH